MGDDRLGEDVRLPQAASIATNRRKVLTISATSTSQFVQLRDPNFAGSEVWFTLYVETPGVNVWLHGGVHVPVTNPLPVATVNDWPLPPNTERNFKLAPGETHIAVVSSAPATIKAYPSCD